MPHYTLFSAMFPTETRPQTSTPGAGPSKAPLRTTKETHPNLPPGLILDKDGKVCKVCNSWQDWGKMRVKKKSATGSNSAMSGMGAFAAMASGTAADTKPTPPRSREDCPADTAALGRSTWTFLHTTAAYYPLQATVETQKQMTNLLSSLSLLYPCVPCAEDFQDKVKENPPDVSGRESLSRWLCQRHNEVNEKLGKEAFGCDWSNLSRRWKDGPDDGSCE